MLKKMAFVVLASGILSGCATVPMADKAVSSQAKAFAEPPAGKAGLYIYRNSTIGGALKKDVRVNGKCIGETAPNMFFYEVVNGGEEQTLSTESEFSPNDLKIKTESGKNYFIRQYIKMGVFVGGAGLEQVSDTQGKADISSLNMAMQGKCSS